MNRALSVLSSISRREWIACTLWAVGFLLPVLMIGG